MRTTKDNKDESFMSAEFSRREALRKAGKLAVFAAAARMLLLSPKAEAEHTIEPDPAPDWEQGWQW